MPLRKLDFWSIFAACLIGRIWLVSPRNGAKMTIVYKICPAALWTEAITKGVFAGAPIDHADGYIHFSNAEQARETAAKYFHGQADLVLVALEDAPFGDTMKWEASRGGALFPHLYGTFAPADALWVKPLPLNSDGSHAFPEL